MWWRGILALPIVEPSEGKFTAEYVGGLWPRLLWTFLKKASEHPVDTIHPMIFYTYWPIPTEIRAMYLLSISTFDYMPIYHNSLFMNSFPDAWVELSWVELSSIWHLFASVVAELLLLQGKVTLASTKLNSLYSIRKPFHLFQLFFSYLCVVPVLLWCIFALMHWCFFYSHCNAFPPLLNSSLSQVGF